MKTIRKPLFTIENKHWLTLAIAASASSMALADKPEATGFIDGSSLNVLNRNLYVNSDVRNNAADEQSYQEEWGHGIVTEFESGYTKGLVGFGLDAHAYVGFKLDTGDGRTDWGQFPVDGDGHTNDQYGETGGAVKMRFSATELKYGDLRPATPVFATGDPGLLPETATGFHLTSQEVDGLLLEAGHFTAFNNAASTNDDDELAPGYGSGAAGETLDIAGATYNINDQLSVKGYTSHFDETWNQYYGNVNYTVPLSDEQSFNIDVNAYRTNDTGDKYQGEINNTSYSAAIAYTVGAHTFIAAHQTVHGDTPFDYIGDDSIALNNSMELSDFNAPNEKSFRLGYELDMEGYGVPGLSFSANYGRGDNTDGTKADPNGGYVDLYADGGKHWERDFAAEYVIQNGIAKDLSVRLVQSTHRANTDQGEDDRDEVQLVFEYPWELL